MDNSPLNKCPKPSRQGIRPPNPPNGQCPNERGFWFVGASLICSMFIKWKADCYIWKVCSSKNNYKLQKFCDYGKFCSSNHFVDHNLILCKSFVISENFIHQTRHILLFIIWFCVMDRLPVDAGQLPPILFVNMSEFITTYCTLSWTILQDFQMR